LRGTSPSRMDDIVLLIIYALVSHVSCSRSIFARIPPRCLFNRSLICISLILRQNPHFRPARKKLSGFVLRKIIGFSRGIPQKTSHNLTAKICHLKFYVAVWPFKRLPDPGGSTKMPKSYLNKPFGYIPRPEFVSGTWRFCRCVILSQGPGPDTYKVRVFSQGHGSHIKFTPVKNLAILTPGEIEEFYSRHPKYLRRLQKG